jgi:tetrahydroxynaphthalene reductase
VQKNQNMGSVTPPALPYRLDGKVALLTGAGRGIGAEMALQLPRCGAKVVVNYVRSTQSAEKVVQEIKDILANWTSSALTPAWCLSAI